MKEKIMNTKIQIISFMKRSFTSRPLTMMILACLALSVLAPAMAAVESNEIGPAIGRMPTVNNVIVSPSNPAWGGTVSVTYDYQDVDGDAESGTSIAWSQGGNILAGKTSNTLVVDQVNGDPCSTVSITAEITPRSVTGTSPRDGTKVSSNTISATPIFPASAIINGITWHRPSAARQNYSVASNTCAINGRRLPSLSELQNVFMTVTGKGIGQTDFGLSNKYGWPAMLRCGGTTGYTYWTESSTQSMYIQNGNPVSGTAADSHYVVCVN